MTFYIKGVEHGDGERRSGAAWCPTLDSLDGPATASIRWTPFSQAQFAASRWDRINITADYLSEARGFAPGEEAEDWLNAQAPIDAIDALTFDG